MLNYYNPVLTEWITSGAFWGWMIAFHLLMLAVPGLIAMITEEPKLFRTSRRDNVVPLIPRKPDEAQRPLQAA